MSAPAVQMVVFVVAGEEYALPVQAVREIARGGALLRLHGAAGSAVGMLDTKGGAVPVVEARERLGMVGEFERAATRHVIVMHHGGGLDVGLAVDAVHEVVTAEHASLLAPPAIFTGRSAAVRALVALEGERLVMLLEPDELLDADEIAALAAAAVGDDGEMETGTLQGDS